MVESCVLYGLLHAVAIMMVTCFGSGSDGYMVSLSVLPLLVALDYAVIRTKWIKPKKRVAWVTPPWPGCDDKPVTHECIDVAGCPVWIVRNNSGK